MADQDKRESFNRLMGLGSYAGGIIVFGLMAFSLYSDGGFKGDYQTYGIGLAVALVMFAIGFTTARGKK